MGGRREEIGLGLELGRGDSFDSYFPYSFKDYATTPGVVVLSLLILFNLQLN